jgi:5'-AMP-activated protein kinase catalytic alpha subunit
MHAAKQEIDALKSLWHPNIVYLYETFIEIEVLFLVFEYCPGGSLASRLHGGPMPQSELYPICQQLIAAVQACHSHGLAHLDIKPANVLIDKHGRVKLADFGTALIAKGGLSKQTKGTPAFLPPEILQKPAYDPFKADVWSLGVTIYTLAAGKLPWPAAPSAFGLRMNGLVSFGPAIPFELKTLLRSMVEPAPEARIRIDQINLNMFDTKPIKRSQFVPPKSRIGLVVPMRCPGSITAYRSKERLCSRCPLPRASPTFALPPLSRAIFDSTSD